MEKSSNEIVIMNKYKLKRQIGKGAFGEVYSALDTETNEEYATKVEPKNAKHPQLNYEYKVMRLLNEGVGVPNVYWGGEVDERVGLVMDRLGPSLEEMFVHGNRKFSLKTVGMLADQLIQRIEFLHSRFFIHRDIKPDNFLIGKT